MAGEKLTRIKIRDGQGISQPVPIQVTADQVTFNNNDTYNDGTVGQVIQNLQTNISNINGKVDINQPSGNAGKFLAINEDNQVIPVALSSAAIEAAMEGYNFTEKINGEIDKRGYENTIQNIQNKISGYSNSRLSNIQNRISNNFNNISTLFNNTQNNTGQINTLFNNISTLDSKITSQKFQIDSEVGELFKNLQDTKVDVKDGYGLSKNNFTDGYKAKLDKVHFGSAINTDSTSGRQVFFGEHPATSRIGFWGNKTTKIGIAISNTEDSKRWRLLAQINTGNTEHRYLGLTLQDYDTSEGRKRGDKQVYNTEYFLPGEFFTVSSGTCYSGLITNESKALHFFIPMPRRCDHSNIKSITATFSKTKTFSVRCPGGYLPNANGSSGPIEMDTNNKKFEFIKKSNGIAVKVTNKDGSKITNINNTNVNVYFTTSFKFTFN